MAILGAQSAVTQAFGQIQRQQARAQADQAERRAASLRDQADQARAQADRAERRADSLQAEAGQARARADQAEGAVRAIEGWDRLGERLSTQFVRAAPSLAGVSSASPSYSSQGSIQQGSGEVGSIVNLSA